MDWNKIKIEYITTDTSYRKLAEKYRVSPNSVYLHAKSEGWYADKLRFNEKTVAKTVEKISEGQAKRAERLQTLADKVLNKLDRALESTEDNNYEALRKITSSLKDIKDIQTVKSEDGESKDITVRLEGELDKYSK